MSTANAIKPRQMLPQFTLQTRDGSSIRVSDFRGKKNLVVIFPAGRDLSLLRDLETRRADLQEENVVVLVIEKASQCGQENQPTGSSQVRFLCDQDGYVSRRFGADQEPAVYIADQYGEIYSVHRAGEGTTLPASDEIFASLRHINAACPE